MGQLDGQVAFITGASSRGWGPNDDPRSLDWPPAELERRCGDAMPQNEAERLEILTGFKHQPPPPGVAEPGWPLQAG